jgi:hypothetical protein
MSQDTGAQPSQGVLPIPKLGFCGSVGSRREALQLSERGRSWIYCRDLWIDRIRWVASLYDCRCDEVSGSGPGLIAGAANLAGLGVADDEGWRGSTLLRLFANGLP